MGVCCSDFVCVLNVGSVSGCWETRFVCELGRWGGGDVNKVLAQHQATEGKKTSVEEGVPRCVYLLFFFSLLLLTHRVLVLTCTMLSFRWPGCLPDVSQVRVQ